MTLGERIKYYRKNQNLSQENLAEKVGVSRQAVTKWESNKTSPSTDNLIIVGEILDISINDLTSDTPISKENKRNEKGLEIGVSLAGVGSAFYYAFSTSNDTFFKMALAIISIIGAFILLGFTWVSYTKKNRLKVSTSNFLYLIIINILGILNKVYGGIIAFILIVFVTFAYQKYLERF